MLIAILLHLFVVPSYSKLEVVDNELGNFVNRESNDSQNSMSNSNVSRTTAKNNADGVTPTPRMTSLPSLPPSLPPLNSQSSLSTHKFPGEKGVLIDSVEISQKDSRPQNMNRLQYSRDFIVKNKDVAVDAVQTKFAENNIADMKTDTREANQDPNNMSDGQMSKRPFAKRSFFCPLMFPSIFPVWHCLRYQELKRRAELLKKLRLNSRITAIPSVSPKSTRNERRIPLMWRFPDYTLYNPKLRSYFRG